MGQELARDSFQDHLNAGLRERDPEDDALVSILSSRGIAKKSSTQINFMRQGSPSFYVRKNKLIYFYYRQLLFS
jgi:hypothetical protein